MNEHLKKVAEFAAEFGGYAAQVFEDGKVSGAEAFGFLPKLMAVPGLLENKEQIKAEWAARTTETLAELNAHVKAVLTLPNKSTEAKIEKSVTFILAAIDLVDEFNKPTD